MRSAEFGFQAVDVENVDAVIEAIRELVSTDLLCHQRSWETYRDRSCDRRHSRRLCRRRRRWRRRRQHRRRRRPIFRLK